MRIIYSSQFEREYRQLPFSLQKKAKTRIKIFCKNNFDGRLKTHKLEGKLSSLYSFSIDFRYRIIFEFAENNVVMFHAIGDHSLYKKL